MYIRKTQFISMYVRIYDRVFNAMQLIKMNIHMNI